VPVFGKAVAFLITSGARVAFYPFEMRCRGVFLKEVRCSFKVGGIFYIYPAPVLPCAWVLGESIYNVFGVR
jgi:hypothetical protein